jgi:hypothetical protein
MAIVITMAIAAQIITARGGLVRLATTWGMTGGSATSTDRARAIVDRQSRTAAWEWAKNGFDWLSG